MSNFEPKIIGFCCNWCSYGAADLAGVSRFHYPANVRIIRVMCSGAVEPLYILDALKKGADGVIVTGCHPGDCHYRSGNYKARRKIALTKKLLAQLGIDPDRLRLEWISAAEGTKFVQTMTDFTEHVKQLGPNPVIQQPGEQSHASR